MPRRPPKRCNYTGCPSPIHYRGLCKFHQPAPWSRHNPDPDRPRGRAWIALKKMIFERDDWKCYVCGKPADEIDHKISIGEDGARWAPENLAAICTDCHETKSKAEALRGSVRARNRRRAYDHED